MEPKKPLEAKYLVAVAVALGLVAFSLYSVTHRNSGSSAVSSSATPELNNLPLAKDAPGLGSELYDKVQNPVAGTLPEANPFTVSAYQNPFE